MLGSDSFLGHNANVKPVVQWLGGKRSLLKTLVSLLPSDYQERVYCEPFLGGGALLFCLQPRVAIANDLNAELINVYGTICENVDAVIAELLTYENTLDFFLAIRRLDRDKEEYDKLTRVQRAARILYLNKTCFNGLYRVNKRGEFNAHWGRIRHCDFVNEAGLRAMNRYLNKANIRFSSYHYANILPSLKENAFVYLDPPYVPVSKTANFDRHTQYGFNEHDQLALYHDCVDLDKRGIKFMLSNSSAQSVVDQFSMSNRFNITYVDCNRMINCDTTKRGKVKEVIIRNYT